MNVARNQGITVEILYESRLNIYLWPFSGRLCDQYVFLTGLITAEGDNNKDTYTETNIKSELSVSCESTSRQADILIYGIKINWKV